MGTRSCIIVKVRPEDKGKVISKTFKGKRFRTKLQKDYIGVYCHWDGYPDGVGRNLLESNNTYEKAMKLIKGGFMSSLDGTKADYYMAWERDEDWKTNHPRQSDKIEVCAGWTEYAYIFEDGKWHVGVVEWHSDDESETIEDVVELTEKVVKNDHPRYWKKK